MKRTLIFILTLFLYFNQLQATTYFVSVSGDDKNDGKSKYKAFKNLAFAIKKVMPGDIILVGSGLYSVDKTIYFTNSGTAGAFIRVEAENLADRPVFDFSKVESKSKGFTLKGNYWHIKGMIIKNASHNGMRITGANNKVEFCDFCENGNSGLQLGDGAANNTIINCDAYFNADPPNYGDADGFACKTDVGTGNKFIGCRAWLNSDDGWDGYLRGSDSITTILENCWAFRNGYFKDGKDAGPQANGNGFKMGGSDDKLLKHNFELTNCLAFENKAHGFDQNSNMGSMTMINCTSYNNVKKNYFISKPVPETSVVTLINCVELGNKISLLKTAIQISNSWQNNLKIVETDFESIVPDGVTNPRKADGSLPDLKFMHLSKTSKLIDAGTPVISIKFKGKKPDLGAFEY